MDEEIIMWYLQKIYWWFDGRISILKQYIMLRMYLRHLKKRIEKNDFGRREEW